MSRDLTDLLAKFSGLNILVIGDLMLDKYIWGDTRRISPEAPVPVISIAKETYHAGGGANVATNLASLGASCEVCGAVGNDGYGEALRALLSDKDVRYSEELIHETAPTIVKTRILARHQQVCRLDQEAPPSSYALKDDAKRAYVIKKASEADAVILSDYAKGTIDSTLVASLQEAIQAKGGLIGLDPKPVRELAFKGIDLLKPNKSEALEMAGIKLAPHEALPHEELCRRIWEKHRPRYLVVTLGEGGMLLSEEGKVLEIMPTEARDVYDVSGAGDTVMASLTAALAAGASLGQAARLANRAASIVVAKVGAVAASKDELAAALQQ